MTGPPGRWGLNGRSCRPQRSTALEPCIRGGGRGPLPCPAAREGIARKGYRHGREISLMLLHFSRQRHMP